MLLLYYSQIGRNQINQKQNEVVPDNQDNKSNVTTVLFTDRAQSNKPKTE